jgi:F-type H+-transporting ATPase subunit delta
MRGTSSTSFGEVLRQTEAAFSAAPGSLEATADGLFTVADAIDSSNQLVRMLSDAGRPAELKEEVVQTLFGARVPAVVLDAVREVVSRRWSEQEDILDALELLGVSALLEQAQQEGVLEQVENELVEVSRLIDAAPELTIALDDLREDPSQREAIITRLLTAHVHRLTILLSARAVGRRSDLKPSTRVQQFARFATDRRRRSFALVTSAVPLSDAQRSRLQSLLTRIYGREVDMNLQVDRDVVGGLRIQIGDDLYDATVLARLSRAEQQMVA